MVFCTSSGTGFQCPKIFHWPLFEGYVKPSKDVCITEYLLGGKTRHEAHIGERLLTDAQEKMLVEWVKVQGRCGVPMTYASVAQYAGAILGQQIGGSWPKRFCKRHPDLKMKTT